MTKNNQILDLIMGGVSPYRIDSADGAKTSLAYDAIYVSTAAKFTTLTDSADANMLTVSNITADTNEVEAGMILRPPQGLTIKAVTVTTSTSGVVWGLTMASPSV